MPRKIPVWKTNTIERGKKIEQLAKQLADLVALEHQDITSAVSYEQYLEVHDNHLQGEDLEEAMKAWIPDLKRASRLRFAEHAIRNILLKKSAPAAPAMLQQSLEDPSDLPF
jgi:hypothetical protein